MAEREESAALGKGLLVGAPHPRAYIGIPEFYDLASHAQFNLLTHLGLREEHSLLDIGCGSLRAGRLFIVYLLPGHYFAIEPNQWLIAQGIERELGNELTELKKPQFHNDRNFTCTIFGREFDFILAHGIFVHTAQWQIRRCLAEARECMKPTSILVANFAEGEENYSGNDWVYPGHVTYRLSWMAKAATESGLIVRPIEWFHPSAEKVRWVLFTRPENRATLEELAASDDLSALKQQVALQKARIQMLQSIVCHPYVRLGFWVKHALQRVGLGQAKGNRVVP